MKIGIILPCTLKSLISKSISFKLLYRIIQSEKFIRSQTGRQISVINFKSTSPTTASTFGLLIVASVCIMVLKCEKQEVIDFVFFL